MTLGSRPRETRHPCGRSHTTQRSAACSPTAQPGALSALRDGLSMPPPHAVPGCNVPSAPSLPAAPPRSWGASCCAATPPAAEPPGISTCPLPADFLAEGAGRASFQSCCRTRGSTLLAAARPRCCLALLPAGAAAAWAARVRCTPLASRACSTRLTPVRQQRSACREGEPHESGTSPLTLQARRL